MTRRRHVGLLGRRRGEQADVAGRQAATPHEVREHGRGVRALEPLRHVEVEDRVDDRLATADQRGRHGHERRGGRDRHALRVDVNVDPLDQLKVMRTPTSALNGGAGKPSASA